MIACRLPRTVVGLVLVGVLTVVSGCSGPGADPDPQVSPPPSSSTTTSPAVRPPELPEAATKPTRAGAKAFFEYFWEVYDYSFKSLDSSLMESISEETCRFCGSVVKDLRQAVSSGTSFKGGEVDVVTVAVPPGSPSRGFLVNGVIDQESGEVVSLSDDRRSRVKSLKDRRVDAAVKWVNGAWKVLAIDLVGEG